MRFAHLSLAGLSLLTACSSYAPPTNLAGIRRDELIARMGQPDRQRGLPTGTRLEFPRGPMGHHTWFVDLDAAGYATRAEQVLTEPNFNQIVPGMAQDEVSQRLALPFTHNYFTQSFPSQGRSPVFSNSGMSLKRSQFDINHRTG